MASLIIVSWFEDVELHFSHFLHLFSMFSRSWCWFFQFPAAVHFMSSCQLHCSLCLVRGGVCRQTLLLTLQLCMTWNLASPTTVPTSCQPFLNHPVHVYWKWHQGNTSHSQYSPCLSAQQPETQWHILILQDRLRWLRMPTNQSSQDQVHIPNRPSYPL